jgi:Domain of unknown function (DUF4843)
MRKLLSLSLLLILVFSSCIKNKEVIYDQPTIEFDAAAWNANAAGLTYPFLTRVPAYGVATTTTTSLTALTRTAGSFKVRVNLLGAQLKTDTEFTFRVVDTESTAVAGTHYTAFTGKGTIPAASSFGYFDVVILNPGATTGTKDLVLELVANNNLKVSSNYAKIGLRIAQN